VATAGSWGQPTTLGNTDVGPLGAIVGASTAMGAAGTAAVTWLDGGVPMAAVRDPGGSFAAAQTLGASGASAPRVAVDGNGGALAVWVAGGLLRVSERSPGGSFTTLAPIAAAAGSPDVAFLGDGTAVVAYRGADGQARVALRAPGGAFVFPAALSSEAGVQDPRVAAAGGYAVVTWIASTTAGTVTTSRASASVLTPGSAFGAPQVLGTGSEDSAVGPLGTGSQVYRTAPTIGPSGGADVLVSSFDDAQERCFANTIARRAPGVGGAWTPSAGSGGGFCAPGSPRSTVDLAAGRADDALLVIGTGARTPTIAVTSNMRPPGAAQYTPGADVFRGPATALSTSQVGVAPLSTGRYLVAFTRDQDLLAAPGWPVYGFEAPVTVASDADQLVGLASSTDEAVLGWVTKGQLRVVLYDDRSVTPLTAGAPVLSRLSLSPRRFAVARGTKIGWRLSAPARVTFRVERVRGGFRRAATCSARRPASGRIKRCTRFVRVGSFTRTAKAGDGSLHFSGVVSRRALRPGRYRLVAIATDAARHRSKAQRALFTVVRR
jgi:hypothetical protein